MIITAKFSSVCPKCSGRISVGSKVEWNKGEKASHVDCGAAKPTVAKVRQPGESASWHNQEPKEGAIVLTYRREPCKRAALADERGIKRLGDKDAARIGHRHVVVETQSASYASSDANEDNQDFGGACWFVTFGCRPATEQEVAAEEATRAPKAVAS